MVNHTFDNRTIYADNVEEILYSRAGYKSQYIAGALHAGYQKLQKHSEYVTRFCFSTATTVARKGLNVMLHVHCLSCSV